MKFLELPEVLELHRRLIQQSGGTGGIRDFGLLESALAQPRMTYDGQDLYPTLIDKAAALAYSLVRNHPFHDGNKRIGHAAMEAFLVWNGMEIQATVDEQEALFLALAAGQASRETLVLWLNSHTCPVE